MSIPDHIRTNFQTMLRAADDQQLGLIEGRDAATGAIRYIICGITLIDDKYYITPFGHLSTGNPYDEYRLDFIEKP